MSVQTCPDCDGFKTLRALVNYGGARGCVSEMVPCITCHGEGQITDEQAAAIEKSERIRRERLDLGETMKQAAQRLGMTLREYNDYEHGRWS